MANLKVSKVYRCSDDCLQSGCPSHEATLSFQTTAGVFSFDNGNGQEIAFDYDSLQAFLDLIQQLSYRADMPKIKQ